MDAGEVFVAIGLLLFVLFSDRLDDLRALAARLVRRLAVRRPDTTLQTIEDDLTRRATFTKSAADFQATLDTRLHAEGITLTRELYSLLSHHQSTSRLPRGLAADLTSLTTRHVERLAALSDEVAAELLRLIKQ